SKGRGRRPKGRHLFINGHLRCGRCDGAMIPRTYDDYEGHPAYGVYSCYRRVRLGPDACEQEPVKRESVDGAVMDYFASSVLDLEATQRQIASAVEHRLAEIRELHGQAERDERKAEDAIVRVKRDYVDGKLDVTDWQELRSELSADLEAARAKRERLQGQEARVASEARVDADSEALRYLSEIRAAVIGSVRNAHGVEAVRAALLTLFDGFTLRRIADSFDRDVFYTSLMCVGPRGAYEMEPHVREDAIAGYGPSGVTPKPRLIGLAQAENNYANGLQT
ncbi:MAG: hypothetical protein QOG35_2787, partial [Solirubrobacteraceae bacterium]|nr:hypothetical protein [Solirubrobacteraceae bacterium]